VCTRADDLATVIEATHPANRADLVFVQNGMLRPLLARYGLAENTQGLLYFAATTRETASPGAPSLFWGPHAAAMADLLASTGIPARVVREREEFAREIAIKLAWNAIFGLLGQHHDLSVGETAARHRDEVEALAAELAPVLARGLDTTVPVPLLVDRLLAYTAEIPTFRATVKELRWRNGWLADTAHARGLPTPLHDALLRTIGVV
jgi:ketopantoate reductase